MRSLTEMDEADALATTSRIDQAGLVPDRSPEPCKRDRTPGTVEWEYHRLLNHDFYFHLQMIGVYSRGFR